MRSLKEKLRVCRGRACPGPILESRVKGGIMIKKGIWKKYPDICDRCIDRMCELKQYNEIIKMCKIFIHKSDN